MLWLSILVRWVLLAAAVLLTVWVMPDASLEGGVWAALWVALLIALANVLVQALMRFLPQPDSVLLLGVLTVVVNGAAIWFIAGVTRWFEVDGFLPAVGAAMLISIFSLVLSNAAARVLPED